MTPAALRFLRELTNRLTLSASDPDFLTIAQQIATAQQELDKELADVNDRADHPYPRS